MRFLVTPGQSKTQAVSTIGTTVMDWYSREKILAERILARVHVAKLWSSIEKSPVYVVLDRHTGRHAGCPQNCHLCHPGNFSVPPGVCLQFATVLSPLYPYLSEIVKWKNPKRWNCLWSALCSQGLSQHVPWALDACIIGLVMSPRPYVCICTLLLTYRAHKRASRD